MELQRFEISDSKLEHNDWKFPPIIKSYPFQADEEDDIAFLVNHKAGFRCQRLHTHANNVLTESQIDRSYDDSTVRFKLLIGNGMSANLEDQTNLPLKPEILKTIKEQGWISDEFQHLWRRDGGGSTTLTSHGILTFLLQTPRDGHSFCSLSLVNRERHCGGLFIADKRYSLNNLLAGKHYQNKQPKIPRDFAILPFNVLVRHIEETLSDVAKLSREITSAEKRIADGDINVDDNGDYKLLNRLNNEHIRVQRRSNFESELGKNLSIYIDEYARMWRSTSEGSIGQSFPYIDEMKEKIDQQTRYSEQLKLDLEVIPRRIKNQSKAIFNFITLRDNKLNIQLAESSRRIAEESRRDNLLNLEMAAATAQVAEETRQDSAAMKTIAVLTLTFLPGTAVASFFSMNMFVWPNPTEGRIVSPFLWVYFVVTLPLTAVVYVAWFMWFKVSQKKFKKDHDTAVHNFEIELKARVRTATGTW